MDTSRGPHSTGVFYADADGTHTVCKHLGTPWDFYCFLDVQAQGKALSNVMLGHNRWATKGEVTARNAHPFDFEKVVGAHNGTLRSVFQLADNKMFDVDSENIYHHMNLHGVHDTIPKLVGAYALTWYNKEDQTVNFFRNDERPLFYVLTEDGKTLFWASEEWMLTVALGLNKIKYQPIEKLPVGVLHTFHVPAANLIKATKLEPVVKEAIEMYKVPFQSKVTGTIITGKHFGNNAVVDKLTKLTARQVQIEVDGTRVTEHGSKFVIAHLVSDPTVDVRLFVSEKDEDLWDQLLFSNNQFSVVCRSFSVLDGGYLLGDIKTLNELTPGNDLPFDKETVAATKKFIGYDGRELTRDDFIDRTSGGCCWCSAVADEDDADDLLWIGQRDHLCGGCKEEPSVKQYLAGTNLE